MEAILGFKVLQINSKDKNGFVMQARYEKKSVLVVSDHLGYFTQISW